MNILTDKFLAIEEEWLANWINSFQPNAIAQQFKEPQVEHVAVNAYSQRELGWLGIDSQEADGKLVAIISISGVLSPEWSWGGVSMQWIGRQISVACDNVNVVAVVLRFNTPGGTVNGTAALAKTIANAGKPVIGHTEFLCASAGLWLSSMCKEHWIASAKTTGIGSLGVMATYTSMAKKLEKDGIDVRVLRSKGSEDKSLLHMMEPFRDKALADQQMLIDTMREEMLAAILSKRTKVSPKISGAMFYGQAAIDAGLADRVGDLDAVIKRAFYLGLK